MGSRPEVDSRKRAPGIRGALLLFAALWVYSLAFGLLALATIRLLRDAVDVSAVRTVGELVVMAVATLTGTFMAVPALRITGMLWRPRGGHWRLSGLRPASTHRVAVRNADRV